jgi:hypothetical protein
MALSLSNMHSARQVTEVLSPPTFKRHECLAMWCKITRTVLTGRRPVTVFLRQVSSGPAVKNHRIILPNCSNHDRDVSDNDDRSGKWRETWKQKDVSRNVRLNTLIRIELDSNVKRDVTTGRLKTLTQDRQDKLFKIVSINRRETNGRPIEFQCSTIKAHLPIERSIFEAIIGQSFVKFTDYHFTNIPLSITSFRRYSVNR